MARVLYIQASPRGERSYSIAGAEAFLEAYRQSHPDDEIVTMNLFDKELPAFDGLTLQGKYNIMHGNDHSAAELEAWREVERLIAEFKEADKYVMAVPMWNFNIPYRLKQYFDIIVQPTYTFNYSPEAGYTGLVTGRPMFISLARGGAYPPGSGFEGYDLQTTYLKVILGFIGITEISSVIIEPTLMQGPEVARRQRAAALVRAREMAASF